MSNPIVLFIQTLILDLKSGRSLSFIINKDGNQDIYVDIINKKNPTHIEFELKALITTGLSGFPILKTLEGLHKKALKQLSFEMEQHSRKAPFLALVPLFLFQTPSLILIFLYPLIVNFLKELS